MFSYTYTVHIIKLTHTLVVHRDILTHTYTQRQVYLYVKGTQGNFDTHFCKLLERC